MGDPVEAILSGTLSREVPAPDARPVHRQGTVRTQHLVGVEIEPVSGSGQKIADQAHQVHPVDRAQIQGHVRDDVDRAVDPPVLVPDGEVPVGDGQGVAQGNAVAEVVHVQDDLQTATPLQQVQGQIVADRLYLHGHQARAGDVDERFHAQKLDQRMANRVQLQHHAVLLVFFEALLEAVDERAFDHSFDDVDGWLSRREEEGEEFEGRGFFIEDQGHPGRRYRPSQIHLDEPVFRGIARIRAPAGGRIAVHHPDRLPGMGAGRADAAAEGRGIQHGVDLLAEPDRADDAGRVQFHRAQGELPLTPLRHRVVAYLIAVDARCGVAAQSQTEKQVKSGSPVHVKPLKSALPLGTTGNALFPNLVFSPADRESGSPAPERRRLPRGCLYCINWWRSSGGPRKPLCRSPGTERTGNRGSPGTWRSDGGRPGAGSGGESSVAAGSCRVGSG